MEDDGAPVKEAGAPLGGKNKDDPDDKDDMDKSKGAPPVWLPTVLPTTEFS